MIWFSFYVFSLMTSLGDSSQLTPLQLESLLTEGNTSRFWLVSFSALAFLVSSIYIGQTSSLKLGKVNIFICLSLSNMLLESTWLVNPKDETLVKGMVLTWTNFLQPWKKLQFSCIRLIVMWFSLSHSPEKSWMVA